MRSPLALARSTLSLMGEGSLWECENMSPYSSITSFLKSHLERKWLRHSVFPSSTASRESQENGSPICTSLMILNSFVRWKLKLTICHPLS